MKIKGTRGDYHPDATKKETTRDDRVRVITLRSMSLKWQEIADRTGLKESCCKVIWHRWLKTQTSSNRPRTGRPVIFNDALKQQLVQFITSSPRTRRLTWEEIIDEMDLRCSVPSNGFYGIS